VGNTAIFATLSAFLGLALQVSLELRLRTLDIPWVEPHQENGAQWNPEVFKALTFGHWTSGIDWLWLKTLLDPSITHVARGTHPAIYYDIDLATDLDPAFHDVYIGGANLIAVVRDDGAGARDLLRKAERFRTQELAGYPESFIQSYWPRSWDVPLLLAYVYLFELDDIKDAATEFKAASLVPGAPPYLTHLSQRLEKPGGEYEVGVKLLGFMIQSATDERAKSKLEYRLGSLQVARYLFELNENFRSFGGSSKDGEKDWKKFLDKIGNPSGKDPFGGELSLDASGRVVSSTPHEKVLGLD